MQLGYQNSIIKKNVIKFWKTDQHLMFDIMLIYRMLNGATVVKSSQAASITVQAKIELRMWLLVKTNITS